MSGRGALDAGVLRAALLLEGFDARAAQGLLEPAFRGTLPPGVRTSAPRDAAALAYVFDRGGELWLPLTLRTDAVPEHGGQVSLPGGRPHAGEALRRTAWREAEEEIGLRVCGAEDLGVLAPVYIPITHTRLHVHVALGPEPEALVPDPREVDRLELVRLADLLDPGRRGRRVLHLRGRDVDVPFVELAGLFVWGATAMALAELAGRLARALAG